MRRLLFVASFCLVAAAAPAQPAGDGSDDLRKQVEALNRRLAALESSRDLDSKLMADRLDRIERLIERLGSRASRSEFTPSDAAPRRGQIRLDNRMAVTGYVTIDGVFYSVPALSTRTLRDIEPGAIRYTLGGDGLATSLARSTRVYAGERLTIQINEP